MLSCSASEACRRIQAIEPAMPIAPQFMPDVANPCLGATPKPSCLPYIHVISGWHMLSDEALGFLRLVKQIDMRNGGCFDSWAEDKGAMQWLRSWGGLPRENSLIATHCNKLLSWYPAFAGRYTAVWSKAYGPCKEREVKAGGDYYATKMWPVCRPEALAAHDAAVGTGGSGAEATPPFAMAALYGTRVRVISAVRNPVDRLETSFWVHRHYPGKYGNSAAGLDAFVSKQTQAFRRCEAKHGTRRCAYLFELLDKNNSDVFFHCDQLIRGMYEPFLRDWHAALGPEALLVITTEQLLDAPAAARKKVLSFVGLADVDADAAVAAPTETYATLHARSLSLQQAQAMLPATRATAEAFYQPHNERLAQLLGDPALAWPSRSLVVNSSLMQLSRELTAGVKERKLPM